VDFAQENGLESGSAQMICSGTIAPGIQQDDAFGRVELYFDHPAGLVAVEVRLLGIQIIHRTSELAGRSLTEELGTIHGGYFA
jgi:hypothetical protein